MDAIDSGEPLSAVDIAWLRMDRPSCLMMICGIMLFERRLRLHAVRELVRRRMLCFHRFTQRVSGAGADARWQDDDAFDLDWHVRHLALPAGEAGETLEDLVGGLVSTPLDRSRPMWQFHLIDDRHGGSALLLRVHHCYGDGFALMHVLSALMDEAPDRTHAAPPDIPPHPAEGSALERILGPAAQAAGAALRTALGAAGVGRGLLAHPLDALALAGAGADYARAAAVIAAMPPDSPTCLKGPLGVMKRVAWAPPMPLAEVKAVAAALACSVNDVLVACITGALRRYLLEQGEAVDGVEVRALVPVNMRPPGPLTDLGNHFGLVFLDLPLATAEPVGRVLEVHRRMRALRESKQPAVSLAILAAMGLAPDDLNQRISDALAGNASLVISNVHGIEQPRYFAGQRIARQLFWVPQSGGISLGLSLLSYAGDIAFGVMADARRVPVPATIAQHFRAEFEILLLTLLMVRWPSRRRAR
jgi:WS/DGAT/MGAT family acyltransferase